MENTSKAVNNQFVSLMTGDLRKEVHRRLSSRVVHLRGGIVLFKDLPDNFAALDGYTPGSQFDIERRKFSFNHHEGVLRHATRSTSEQVLDAALLGLDFSTLTLGINDVDTDTTLAVTVALFNEICMPPFLDETRKIIRLAGALDSHGPAYPSEEPKTLREFLGFIIPENSRVSKTADINGNESMKSFLEEGVTRVLLFLSGKRCPREETERNFTIFSLNETCGVVMVESDFDVMDLAYEICPRVIAFRRLQDKSFAYTIAKRSEFIMGFPLHKILMTLNNRETSIATEENRLTGSWGGASTIVGSPRNADGSRSRIKPEEVWEIVMHEITGKKDDSRIFSDLPCTENSG